MKQRDFKPCCICGRGVAHRGDIAFYRITVEQMVIDAAAVNRQHGFEAMLGGHSPAHGAIAQAMGPDEDLAISMNKDRPTKLVCLPCALETGVCVVAEAEAKGSG